MTDARGQGELAVVLAGWRARGQYGCPDGIQAYYARSLKGADGGADGRGGGCATWLDLSFVRMLRNDRGLGRWVRRSDVEQECDAQAHEVGHALGLTHEDAWRFPVMSPLGYADPNGTWPECVRWGRTLFPSRR